MNFLVTLVSFPVMAVLLLIPPSQAQAPPGQSTTSSSVPHTRKPAPALASRLDAGSVSNGNYRNKTFAFTCKLPPGWVLRTEELNAREDEVPNTGAGKPADSANAERVLLATFARPPEAHGEDVNSSILIAAESVASYPGLIDAAQYFGPVREAAKAQGLEMLDEPYEFAVGSKTVVRGDFQKNVGTRVMRQSTLVILDRGYAVSFTFIGGTEDEVEELIQNLAFATPPKPQSH
jgi:hypothetical protein